MRCDRAAPRLTYRLRAEPARRHGTFYRVRPRVTQRGPVVPNVNVTYVEMQSAARQLQAGEQTIEADLAKLKRLVLQG
jgi:hypothetical protein